MSGLSRSIMLIAALAITPAAAALAQNTPPKDTTGQNPGTPGATGRTVVKGDNSTLQGDRSGTREQKSGDAGGR